MRVRPLMSAVAVVAIGASLMGSPAVLAGSGTTRYVDDDGKAGAAGCDGTATVKKKIQAAVDVANDGDTILVCPGTYVGSVTIEARSGLTLRSVNDWQAVIKNTPQVPVVAGPGGTTPWMVGIFGSQDITVRGFKLVHEAIASCGSSFGDVGIVFYAARDVKIRSNRVIGTGDALSECGLVAGIIAGDPLTPAGAASAAPAGLPDDLTTTGLIAYNVVRDHAFLGIAAMNSEPLTAGAAPAPTKVDIRNNSIKYYHLGQPADACSSAPISAGEKRSLRTGLRKLLPAGPGGIPCFGIGIYQGAGTSDAAGPGVSGLISRNRIMSGPDAVFTFIVGADPETPAQLAGIVIVDQKHADGASTVRENIVRRNGFGIVAVDAAGVRIVDNAVRETFFGISVWDTEGGATVRGNRARDSVVGIWANDEPFYSSASPDYVTKDVLFKGNDATDNLDVSCEDDTEGTGTEGTANTWTDNDGEVNSSDPDGICGPKEL